MLKVVNIANIANVPNTEVGVELLSDHRKYQPGRPDQARDICNLVVIISQSTPPVVPLQSSRDFTVKQNEYNNPMAIRWLVRTFRISLRGKY